MYDTIERPNYEAFEGELRAVSAALNASEAHGTLCGLLCADEKTMPVAWEPQVFGGLGAEEAGCPHCHDMIEEIFRWTHRGFNDEELQFEMLLPGDESPLGDRTAALASWAEGFLVGLGLGGFQEDDAMSAETRETLADLAEISQAEIPDDGGDEEEDAYLEIVEYIRVAVMLIHEEMQPVLRPNQIH